MSYIAFDTETTGKFNFKKPAIDACQPRIVSMGVALFSDDHSEIGSFSTLIKPEGFEIPAEATAIHGITTEDALKYGMDFDVAYYAVCQFINTADMVLIFNEQFDRNMLNSETSRRGMGDSYLQQNEANKKIRCMMRLMTGHCRLPGGYDGDWKWPSLAESYEWLFQQKLEGAHGAIADARATGWIAAGMIKAGLWDGKTHT